MGLLDKLTKVIGMEKKENDTTNANEKRNDSIEEIVLLPSSHVVEETEFGEDESEYCITFKVNDAFKETKSHAAEVTMLNTYALNDEYGNEGKIPYIAIIMDDEIYCGMEEFKENGIFSDAIEITPLDGKFYFKAKKEYYGDMMYFYGFDRCEGFWENSALCIVYPISYVGTQNEKTLINVLDEAARSYHEEKIES